jgi:hypothetical protein
MRHRPITLLRDSRIGRRGILGAVMALAFAGGMATRAPAAELESPVASGREAFQHGTYPWYDAQQDALKPITLRPTEPRRERPMSAPWILPSWTTTVVWVVLAVLLIGVAVLLVLLYRDARVKRFRASAAANDQVVDADQVEALPFMASRPRGDLLGQARRYYEQGNYNEAIIYLFSHELVQLDKSGLIDLAHGKTNYQYLREVAHSQQVKLSLELTMGAFERVFFGGRTLDRASFESCWNMLGAFENLAAGSLA